MEKRKIERINELARKKREEGLLPHELEEQAALRQESVAEFRQSVASALENTYIQRPDGTKERIKKKK